MFEVVIQPDTLKNLDSFILPFLKSLDIRQSSRDTYSRQLREFLVWRMHTSSGTLVRQDLLEYKDYLKYDKNLTAFTIGGYLTAVRRFFEWLESMQIYPNIAKGIKGPKRKRGFKKDALTIDQAKLLLSAIDRSTLTGKRDFAMLNLMVRTGLRTIEIIRATREDIGRQGGEPVLFIHGKGRDSKDEIVLLTESTLGPIRDYFVARGRVRDEDPVFASHSTKNWGKRLTTRSISRIAKNRLKAIDINDIRLTAHSLRHTAITFSLLAGATPQEARAMARHSDINTTLIYAHNINRITQAPERKIDAFLDDVI
jgi:integrase/recombinase XerD